MLYIEGYTIQLTRGDTAYLTIPLHCATEEYVMQPTDTLTFTIKRTVGDTEFIVQKISTGANEFHIEPNDTAALKFGKYKYDVQLNMADGDVYTVIPPSTFEVLPEVTY